MIKKWRQIAKGFAACGVQNPKYSEIQCFRLRVGHLTSITRFFSSTFSFVVFGILM